MKKTPRTIKTKAKPRVRIPRTEEQEKKTKIRKRRVKKKVETVENKNSDEEEKIKLADDPFKYIKGMAEEIQKNGVENKNLDDVEEEIELSADPFKDSKSITEIKNEASEGFVEEILAIKRAKILQKKKRGIYCY